MNVFLEEINVCPQKTSANAQITRKNLLNSWVLLKDGISARILEYSDDILRLFCKKIPLEFTKRRNVPEKA